MPLIVSKDGFYIAGAMQNPLDTDAMVMNSVENDLGSKDDRSQGQYLGYLFRAGENQTQ
ncbi:hypothetical protein RGR602_PC01154 (plasmid) [Rhizobium gallicum bv. gallicum R602sp]|uniref:Uncharacterized protein n=1 Tax=Rhizobium gallicum bv. gallicum R602sp TaxID=1041138 RepID=A0A0B4XB13_9HYPH|nr:hypothetical protein RGR602_PC01154 [Rhizobium gallicum bv. gallicum R602sp]